jgi:hypothetical protein
MRGEDRRGEERRGERREEEGGLFLFSFLLGECF